MAERLSDGSPLLAPRMIDPGLIDRFKATFCEEAQNKTSSAGTKHTLCVFCQLGQAVNPPKQRRSDRDTLYLSLTHTHTHRSSYHWLNYSLSHTLTKLSPPKKNPRTTTHVQNFSFFPLRRVVKLSLSLHYEPFTPASTLLCRKIVKVWSNIDEL